MSTTNMDIHAAYENFKQADIVWSACLVRVFGKQASGDKRYTLDGQEHPLCAEAYREFRRTNDEWLRLVEQKRKES